MAHAKALDELREDLRVALGPKIERDGQALSLADRASLVNALVAISDFLYKIDGLHLFHFQFNELASALSDLDRGAQHAVLTPKRSGRGHPPDPTDLLCAQGRVAFAIEMLVRAEMHDQVGHRTGSKRRAGPGRPRSGEPTRATIIKQSAQAVANQFPRLRQLVSKGAKSRTLAGSIMYWHDKFSFDQTGNSEASEMYLDLKEKLRKIEESKAFSPAKLKRFAIDHLRVTSKLTAAEKES